MFRNEYRSRLRNAAAAIAARTGQPYGPWTALRKMFVQERRDKSLPHRPRVGWKRGEVFEVLEAALRRDRDALVEEWGDMAYYLAQSPWFFWFIYVLVTPQNVLERAARKFERRAGLR